MKKYIVTIIVALVVGIAAFYGGMQYGAAANTSKTVAGATTGGFQRGTGGGRAGSGAFANGGVVAGQVISVDAQSITVQQGSSTKIVFYSGTTAIMKSASGTIGDVQSGANVMVVGTPNSDGSITAQTIQLRNGGGPGRGGAGQ